MPQPPPPGPIIVFEDPPGLMRPTCLLPLSGLAGLKVVPDCGANIVLKKRIQNAIKPQKSEASRSMTEFLRARVVEEPSPTTSPLTILMTMVETEAHNKNN
mmetsp:Transcript_41614/g.89343  ORF Transcript_41614/g.89343 Transcript_41614/m.89343 type:complete len:101 (-) Transcript_41614:259-561(-)|eukprot:CAMPEP_0206461708 /NCGR_PEP_ID=MMETSP0324_2-20121206/25530_1 /ASSEMBLY_ACC=CAM_ASM_000836 /TAXON_ID=2866 /ORGANISM="Crypthecodinium cohnii, Strain Seligo" /LENGTH=100 /DNA_ID=CAMNT_0053933697 /DNA_START=74 /DNA_END=376 /DNA_ORIENTATION=-